MPLSRNTRNTIVSSALVVSLLAGGAVIPANTIHAAEAAAINFTDVKSGHWAEKHISKLALQGIITGYNGLFRPSESVTRQEAVLMALRFAGLDGEVDTDNVIAYPSSFVVSNFYKAYIALAFDKNLLDREDEYALAASETNRDWGTAPASREWVTKLMVRAIGEEDTAEKMETAPSSFGDAGTIDSSYVGYVNAAVSLELVKGVTETKFDPKADVNRAALATMFSRAQKLYPVSYEGQHDGIITNVSSSSISIYQDGKESTYAINAGTRFYRYDTETAATLSDLKPYTDVTIISEGGNALYIETQGDEQYIDTFEAVLDRVIEDKQVMYVWIDDEPVQIQYGDELVVTDSNGKKVDLDSISRDSVIAITQDTFRSSPVALAIEVTTEASEGTAEGIFYSTDNELITIMADGSPVSFVLADDVEIEIEGLDDPDFGDFVKNLDEVELTLDEDGLVTKVEAVNRDVDVVADASIISYDETNALLTIVDSTGKPSALYLAENTRFKYDGSSLTRSNALSMLKVGRLVSLTYTDNAIVSLEFLASYTGTISKIDTSNKKLSLKTDNGGTVSIAYDSPAVEIVGVTSPSIANLAAGDAVTVKLTSSQDKAASIKLHKDVQYDVVKVLEDGAKIQVSSESGTGFRLDVSAAELLDEDGDEISANAYHPGDVITVSYEGLTPVTVAEEPVTLGAVSSATSSSLTLTTSEGKAVIVPFDDETSTLYVDGSKVSALSSSLKGKYAAVYADSKDNTVIYVSSGVAKSFSAYDASSDQLTTVFSGSSSNNYFMIRPETVLDGNGSELDPASLSYGEQITVYSFRNTAIAIKKG